jgi:hypothetical protein
MQEATLKLIEGDWYVQFHNCPNVKQMFGSPFVRTPYTDKHDPDWVLTEVLITLNECLVTLERPGA